MLTRLMANAAALAVATILLPGIYLETETPGHKAFAILLVATIFGLLNVLVKPLLKVLTFPAIVLTLGLFLLVVNACMLMLTSWVGQQVGLAWHVDGWLSAILGSVIISLVSGLVGGLLSGEER
ncbi:phage holin family protein [Luteococcus peritonei]|uniref:Phage holin family protein n=1 Tax=Luteococcus peritonei TaxID=88874 RepID=A0ABW4RZ31_9ACTN